MARVNKISLDTNGLNFKGKFFEYKNVKSLMYYYEITNVIGAGKDHRVDLDIIVDEQDKPIKIRSNMPLTYFTLGKTKSSAEQVQQLFLDLGEKTFEHRLNRYLKMLDNHGYFVYDQKKFYPDGRVIDSKKGELNFKTDKPIYREPFKIYYKTEKTLLQKLAHLWTLQDYIIETLYDPDIFFYLMEKIYGLR